MNLHQWEEQNGTNLKTIEIFHILLIVNNNNFQEYFRHVGMDEYPYSHYPTHCQGLFYLMDIHVISKLISLFEIEYGRNYVWIEDVFITGTYKWLQEYNNKLWNVMYLFHLGILPFLSEKITHHNIGSLILRYPNLPQNINDTKNLPLAIIMEGNFFERIVL